MTIREAKNLLKEVIIRANECQQPYRCRWHNRSYIDMKRCPFEHWHGCDCHKYAKALRTLAAASRKNHGECK